jgi:UDP-N-acetylmuramoyl-tripeptide--D-alanyl-D-alanine ligase
VKKLVVNADDSFLMEGVRAKFKGEIITFAIETQDADLIAKDIVFSDEGTGFLLCAGKECIDISLKIHGRFNVYNSLAGAAAAYAIGFNLQEIKRGLESFEGVNMRFEIKKVRGVTFLNDVYNANPSSMEESINELTRLVSSDKYKRAIAVLGDMLELGDYGVTEHKKLGQRLSGIPVDAFIGVGPLMSFAVSEFRGNGICADTSEDAGVKLSEIIDDGDIVLIKGSRGMRMERVMAVVEGLKESIGYTGDFSGQHRG